MILNDTPYVLFPYFQDPDGYKFELIQRPPTPEPFCQVMLRVGNLEKSIEFYEKVNKKKKKKKTFLLS